MLGWVVKKETQEVSACLANANRISSRVITTESDFPSVSLKFDWLPSSASNRRFRPILQVFIPAFSPNVPLAHWIYDTNPADLENIGPGVPGFLLLLLF